MAHIQDLDDEIAVIVMKSMVHIIPIFNVDERAWSEVAKDQVIDVGRLDLVVHIGLWPA
jgi:hypothetical protein